MKTIDMSVLIQRPIAVVFEAISDARAQPRWDPGLLEGRHEPDGPIGVGTRVTERRRMFGMVSENSGEIIALDAPNRYVRRGSDGPVTLTGTITCTSVPSGTRIDWQWLLEVSGPMRLVEGLFARMLRKSAQGVLNNLKSMLEAS
jgi:uncharacterized protein YndB with AHSA1/START domain